MDKKVLLFIEWMQTPLGEFNKENLNEFEEMCREYKEIMELKNLTNTDLYRKITRKLEQIKKFKERSKKSSKSNAKLLKLLDEFWEKKLSGNL